MLLRMALAPRLTVPVQESVVMGRSTCRLDGLRRPIRPMPHPILARGRRSSTLIVALFQTTQPPAPCACPRWGSAPIWVGPRRPACDLPGRVRLYVAFTTDGKVMRPTVPASLYPWSRSSWSAEGTLEPIDSGGFRAILGLFKGSRGSPCLSLAPPLGPTDAWAPLHRRRVITPHAARPTADRLTALAVSTAWREPTLRWIES